MKLILFFQIPRKEKFMISTVSKVLKEMLISILEIWDLGLMMVDSLSKMQMIFSKISSKTWDLMMTMTFSTLGLETKNKVPISRSLTIHLVLALETLVDLVILEDLEMMMGLVETLEDKLLLVNLHHLVVILELENLFKLQLKQLMEKP